MIRYDAQEFEKIQLVFPNLYYDKKDNAIKGELDFSACYEERPRKRGIDRWKIVPCSSGSNCLHDCYEIIILLDDTQEGWPKVFEIGKRISRLAREVGKEIIDLHIYPHDNSCCLGICISSNIMLYDFVLNRVYPYFVWQAYFERYRRLPPCGEYSHDEKGYQELMQDLRQVSRNDLCFCDSGKKYKRCCINNEQAIMNFFCKTYTSKVVKVR